MDIPKGLWYKSTGKIIDADELARNLFVSPEDGFHVRIGSTEYFQFYLTTMNLLNLIKHDLKDPLHFVDTKNMID
jgi:acetyl-CoA carboxylase carboxyl transferase subunit beta